MTLTALVLLHLVCADYTTETWELRAGDNIIGCFNAPGMGGPLTGTTALLYRRVMVMLQASVRTCAGCAQMAKRRSSACAVATK